MYRLNTKITLLLSFSLLTIFLFTSAVIAETTRLTLLTNGDPKYLEATRQFLDQFEDHYPDINVKLQIGGLDKFTTMVVSGTPPDLVRMYGDTVPSYAAQGTLMDISDLAEASDSVDIDDFVPAVMNSLRYDGNLYAIPFGVTVEVGFYNRDHFNIAGVEFPDQSWTWEEDMIRAGKKMTVDTSGDGINEQFFVDPIITSGHHSFTLVYSAGGHVFSQDGSAFLANSVAGRKAFDFLAALRFEHNVMPQPGEPGGPWSYQFQSGKTSYCQLGSWYVAQLERESAAPLNWDVMLLPKFSGGRGTNVWPETPVAIPVGAKDVNASWKVLEFIGSIEGQKLLTNLGLAMPPVRLTVATDTFLERAHPSNIKAIVDMSVAPLNHTLPCFPKYTEVRGILFQAIDNILNGKKSAKIALTEAEDKLTALLSE